MPFKSLRSRLRKDSTILQPIAIRKPSIMSLPLPEELCIRIMENLECRSLVKCIQVSLLFRELVVGTASLQYIIELAVAGQRDNQQSNMPSVSKLALLKKHQMAWRSLKYCKEYHIPFEDGGLWELYGGVLALRTAENKLVLHQLPSGLRSIEQKTWIVDLGVHICDFGIDPSQDLLVLIENPSSLAQGERYHRIHLRLLSTGEVHTGATNRPVLDLHHKAANIVTPPYVIQVSGVLVAILIATMLGHELAIWDWASGNLLCNLHDHEEHSGLSPGKIMTFSLLSNDWVILGMKDDTDQPFLFAVNFREDGQERLSVMQVKRRVIFRYPTFRTSNRLYKMEIRADPGPLWEPNSTDQRARAPFHCDTKDFIMVVTLPSMVHFIPSGYILSLAQRSELNATSEHDWSLWSMERTHVIMPWSFPSSTWLCYAYGTKYVFSDPRYNDDNQFLVRVLDFNQLALQEFDTGLSVGAAGVRPKTLAKDMKKLLEKASLPYSSSAILLDDAHEHCCVMCSEDNIIIVDDECRRFRVLVF